MYKMMLGATHFISIVRKEHTGASGGAVWVDDDRRLTLDATWVGGWQRLPVLTRRSRVRLTHDWPETTHTIFAQAIAKMVVVAFECQNSIVAPCGVRSISFGPPQ